jgi:hypothetical protein
MWNGALEVYFGLLRQNLPGGTERNEIIPWSLLQGSGQRIKTASFAVSQMYRGISVGTTPRWDFRQRHGFLSWL